MAYTPDFFTASRALAPGQRTALLVAARHVRQAGARPENAGDWASAAGATDVGLQYTLVNETVVKAARAAGLLPGVWTGDAEPAMRRAGGPGGGGLTPHPPARGRGRRR